VTGIPALAAVIGVFVDLQLMVFFFTLGGRKIALSGRR
jgi:hypothetical protein